MSSICSSFSAINWHWWNPKELVSCRYLSPFQEEWQVTCVQLSTSFPVLSTLQVTGTHTICSNIIAHLDKYKLMSDRQHTFRKGHSCETQLTTVINDWAKILDNRGHVEPFILDFEKAFDTYPHELLKASLTFKCMTEHLFVDSSYSIALDTYLWKQMMQMNRKLIHIWYNVDKKHLLFTKRKCHKFSWLFTASRCSPRRRSICACRIACKVLVSIGLYSLSFGFLKKASFLENRVCKKGQVKVLLYRASIWITIEIFFLCKFKCFFPHRFIITFLI